MAGHQAPVAAVGRGRAFGLGVGHVGIGPDLADLRTHVGHGGDGTGAQVELENLHAQAIGGQEVQAVRVGGMPEGFGVAGQPCGVAGEVVEHLQRLARVGIEHVPEAGRVFEQEAAAVGVEGLAAGIVVAQVGCLFRLLAGLVVGHAHDAAAEGGILRGNQIVWARAIGYGRDCRAGNERVDAGQDGVAELRAAGLRGGCGAGLVPGAGEVLSWLGSAAGERCVAGAGLLAGVVPCPSRPEPLLALSVFGPLPVPFPRLPEPVPAWFAPLPAPWLVSFPFRYCRCRFCRCHRCPAGSVRG